MSTLLLQETLAHGHDVARVRLKARQLAERLGLDAMAQTRLATAVSEALRPIVAAGSAKLCFDVAGDELHVRITSAAALPGDLNGPGVSGIAAAQRLMDRVEAKAVDARRRELLLTRRLPAAPDRRTLDAVKSALAKDADPALDAEHAYRELSSLFGELSARQQELERVNRELEETNRGVVALYAELDERAEALRKVSEIKSRFISNVSHEFRTPINSILSLSRLLLDRLDGPLTEEQARQVDFIRRSADALSELVNDLLDLAKIERGKVDVRPARFEIPEFFAALRGMLRPLLTNENVSLVFEQTPFPALRTDEGKVSQILRNLVSNALKFTDRGEVRVKVDLEPGGIAHFAVSDTGIGIAPSDQEKIFEEFVQVEGPHQTKVKGTGLGLPLSRRLAELLGGTLTVESEPGKGSTFHLRIPSQFREAGAAEEPSAARARPAVPARQEETLRREERSRHAPLLLVEDDAQTAFVYRRYLEEAGYRVVAAHSLDDARDELRRFRPSAVVLDVLMGASTSWDFLAELRADAGTRDVPVLVATVLDDRQKARALGADEFGVKPIERDWLLAQLERLVRKSTPCTILVIDDDPTSRYMLRRALEGTQWNVCEASGGKMGLEAAARERPDVILLDLNMPDMSGFDVLDALKSDEATRNVPVIIHSSKQLDPDDRQRAAAAQGFLAKAELTREVAMERIGEALRHAWPGGAPTAASDGRP